MQTYPINEIFETLQGEASYTGTPAVFVRFQGCPVGCGWCDTKHTWEIDQDKQISIQYMVTKTADNDSYAVMTTTDILDALALYQANHIVLTGGEPAMYDLNELTSKLIDLGYSVQLETSGTHEIRCDCRVFVTVSPKVGMAGGLQVLPSALGLADEIKYPVGRERDIEQLLELDIPIETPIWLQPLSQNKAATALCIATATQHRFQVSIQTHKFIGVR